MMQAQNGLLRFSKIDARPCRSHISSKDAAPQAFHETLPGHRVQQALRFVGFMTPPPQAAERFPVSATTLCRIPSARECGTRQNDKYINIVKYIDFSQSVTELPGGQS
ncbi:hypothetical protein [Zoogloea sp.]|uniref:hypothetical protein n=1 Tax=Zoogloea sp. TaxID=49181 RepID=UPI0035B386D1